MRRRLFAGSLLAAWLLPGYAGAQQSLHGRALLNALRAGGYVIVMRHATTEAKPDAPHVDLADCATQRNLTLEGRTLARSIGSAFDQLQIPLGRVVSSPFCRAEDTGALAFGHEETNAGLGDKAVKNAGAAADAASALRPLIATTPQPGKVTIVVTHGFNIRSVVGDDFVEGEAAVFKPDGKGRFALVARVLPQDWAKLEQ
jgi:phosphohistidine phosphatase SixA